MMVDETVVEKLKRVVKTLDEKGGLRLFAIVWRENLKRWDVLVSADWIVYSKMSDNIGIIYDALKKEFNGEFALRFSSIEPLQTDEMIVKDLTGTISIEPNSVADFEDVTIGNTTINKMVLFVSR